MASGVLAACIEMCILVKDSLGHDIGIAKHSPADNIKQEYSKFEQAVSFRSVYE